MSRSIFSRPGAIAVLVTPAIAVILFAIIAPIALSGQIPTKGTFTGKHTAIHFTGTWDCHGVIYKS